MKTAKFFFMVCVSIISVSEISSMQLGTKRLYNLSHGKKNVRNKMMGGMLPPTMGGMSSPIGKTMMTLYLMSPSDKKEGGKDEGKSQRCPHHSLCCKEFHTKTQEHRIKVFNNIENKFTYVVNLEKDIFDLYQYEMERRLLFAKGEINAQEYNKRVDRVECAKDCYNKHLVFFVEHKEKYYQQQKDLYERKISEELQESYDDVSSLQKRINNRMRWNLAFLSKIQENYYQQQQKLYEEKFQKKQQQIRDKAITYEAKLIAQKNGIESSIENSSCILYLIQKERIKEDVLNLYEHGMSLIKHSNSSNNS